MLITGPTGSGKSSTLYAALKTFDAETLKIITIEDLVEYHLDKVIHTQVNKKISLDFAKILRASLRQDPDIIIVGEIRDYETANIAMKAAMTGHVVFSTLHTNDSSSSALRLMDMGIKGYLIATCLDRSVSSAFST